MKKATHVLILMVILLSSCNAPPALTENGQSTATISTVVPSITSTRQTPELLTATTAPSATASPPSATESAPAATATETVASGSDGESSTPTGAVIVDHTSLALFEQIPDQYLEAARNTRMMYLDASVGQNINEALNCLASSSWAQSPASCRRDYDNVSTANWTWKTYTAADLRNGNVPRRIQFQPDPARYDRVNWTFVPAPGEWESLLKEFIEEITPQYIERTEVLSYQFNYLHVTTNSLIADPSEGFFTDQPKNGFYINRERWDISDLNELEAQYPDKIFIYWTTSLSRAIGTDVSTQFNQQMRDYALANGKYLFDVADILSHDELGEPCYDNRDDVEYCGANGCENNPDDGENYLAICQDYTTEIDGGHLGSVSAGKLRLAKGFWILMAQIAGWEP